jgi:hypothetical protein
MTRPPFSTSWSRPPDLVDRITREASIPIGSTAQEFATYLRSEFIKRAKVMGGSGPKFE